MFRYRVSAEGRLEADCAGHSAAARGANPPLIFLAALLLVVAVGVVTPWRLPDAGAVPWLAALLVVTGLGLNAAGSGQFRRAGTPIKPGTPSTALVVTGVFRVSRNPMYLGMALVLTGAALGLRSLAALMIVPLFVAYIGRCFITAEEAMLERRFGAEYDAYRLRVRRWVGPAYAPATLRTVGWWTLLAICLVYAIFAFSMAGLEIGSWLGLVAEVKARAVPGPFVLHAVFGGICLMTGPLQFHAGLRRRRRSLHRILGRTYALAVFLAGVTALWTTLFFDVPLASKAAFGVLAALWVTTTVVAITHIAAGRVSAHGEWMARSFALSLFFVTFSVVTPAVLATGLERSVAHPLGVFLSWAVNLAAAEAWIRLRRRPAPASVQP